MPAALLKPEFLHLPNKRWQYEKVNMDCFVAFLLFSGAKLYYNSESKFLLLLFHGEMQRDMLKPYEASILIRNKNLIIRGKESFSISPKLFCL
jgi:hypothetical protein